MTHRTGQDFDNITTSQTCQSSQPIVVGWQHNMSVPNKPKTYSGHSLYNKLLLSAKIQKSIEILSAMPIKRRCG